MSFGKLYAYAGNPRTISALILAKENGLDVEFVDTTRLGTEEVLKLNPLGKVPFFVGSDGFIVSECIAVNLYFAQQNEKTTLLGKSKQDFASVMKWMSFMNSEVLPILAGWFRPLIGKDPFIMKNIEAAIPKTNKLFTILEDHLLHNTFLAAERLTVADLFAAGICTRGFNIVFDPEWRQKYPNVTRWYDLIVNQPCYKNVVGESKFLDGPVKLAPPAGMEPKKKEPKKETKKEAPPPKAAAKEAKPANDEEEEAPPAPKPKHPLDSLPKPTMILDDWKRKYSNEDTRPVALPWLWENYKPEEYSLWKVEYKYNDELTQVFMTSNLIGGFFNRLEASRKHLFGAMSVYGEANNSIVAGAFLVRGQEDVPAFDVAPDHESYTFTKLDHTNPEQKAYVEDQWAWDKGYQGKPWADGKVFK